VSPWLYGLAAVMNLARVGSREHWVSDTVAGSFLGYALGALAWDARRGSKGKKDGPAVVVGGVGVGGGIGVAHTPALSPDQEWGPFFAQPRRSGRRPRRLAITNPMDYPTPC
jgi:hypothetical protein